MTILISCETGGDRVPDWLAGSSFLLPQDSIRLGPAAEVGGDGVPLCQHAERLLPNITLAHPAFMPGHLPAQLPGDEPARYVARRLAKLLCVPVIENVHSPELIDVTRSTRHRNVMSATVRRWPDEVRQRLIDEVHTAYRTRVQHAIEQQTRRSGYAIHVSVRSFALRSNGMLRRTDIGLLYDPSRDDEVDFCLDWMDEMYDVIPMVRVRRNYPRRGTTESLITAMRNYFPAERYIGVELLLNRAWAKRRVSQRDRVIQGICDSLLALQGSQVANAA
ncbi:N-formylglutamate amidohydrolase [Novipirellula galeiformis]|uniref:N-formylglutamate amidohydrolase n=1 Tax=Novipirellula galeiformis TaxID=2528004 RepID=A0A5C6CNU4_9BACT|nr:hypothetical protein [Novipirellula galeiformis]TWU25051.1 N-formylglutamate amidohydrolase [Novipirellula galeiformis]